MIYIHRWADFLWNELIYGGHWFSISAAALVLSIMILLQVQIRWELLLVIYLLIQCLFNYNHYKELDIDAESKSDRPAHLRKYKKILPIVTLIYGIGFCALIIFFGNLISLFFALSLLTIGLLFTKIFKKWTVKLVGFKTFYAAFTFSLLIVIFSALYCSYQINLLIILLCILFSLRFIIGTGFSDIKDIEIDIKQNLKTLPIYFGREKFLTILQLLNIITFALFVIIVTITNTACLLMVFFTYIYTFFYTQKAKNEKADIQSITNILVDGEYIFWPILLFISLIV